jgi:hypothetical protein
MYVKAALPRQPAEAQKCWFFNSSQMLTETVDIQLPLIYTGKRWKPVRPAPRPAFEQLLHQEGIAMKKLALVVAVATLGLAACNNTASDTAGNNTATDLNATEGAAGVDVDNAANEAGAVNSTNNALDSVGGAIGNTAGDLGNAAGNALDATGNAVSNATH